MRYSIWIAGALLALICGAALAQGAAKPTRKVIAVDRIVAVVNDEVITKLDLDDQLKITADTLKRQGTPLPTDDVLEKQVLERMIATKTQLQFA